MTITATLEEKVVPEIKTSTTIYRYYFETLPQTPTAHDYESALIQDGASPEFARLFAERITATGEEYEIKSS